LHYINNHHNKRPSAFCGKSRGFTSTKEPWRRENLWDTQ
jgi:hypothetical protein